MLGGNVCEFAFEACSVCGALTAHFFGDAKVCEFDCTRHTQENVRWRNISMNDARRSSGSTCWHVSVRIVERKREVVCDQCGDRPGQCFIGLSPEQVTKVHAFDELKRKMGLGNAAAAPAPTAAVRVSTEEHAAESQETSEAAELEAVLAAAKARRQNG